VGLDYSIAPVGWHGVAVLPAGIIGPVVFSVVYLLTRRLVSCLVLLARREVPKEAELLVLRHENAVLRRQTARVRYQPADRLWPAALSALIPRHR